MFYDLLAINTYIYTILFKNDVGYISTYDKTNRKLLRSTAPVLALVLDVCTLLLLWQQWSDIQLGENKKVCIELVAIDKTNPSFKCVIFFGVLDHAVVRKSYVKKVTVYVLCSLWRRWQLFWCLLVFFRLFRQSCFGYNVVTHVLVSTRKFNLPSFSCRFCCNVYPETIRKRTLKYDWKNQYENIFSFKRFYDNNNTDEREAEAANRWLDGKNVVRPLQDLGWW